MNKLWLLKQVFITAVVILLLWNGILWVAGRYGLAPGPHREILYTMILLWVATVIIDSPRDDDWAGEF